VSLTVEELAKKMMWKGKEDFQGHEDDFVNAETFILRGQDIQESMRKRSKETNKKITAMAQTIKDVKSHYEATLKAETARQQKRLTELRTERDEAIEEADKEKVDAVESEMADLYEATSKPMQREDEEEDSEEIVEFTDWHKGNSWYTLRGTKSGDKAMTEYADNLSKLPENKILPYERRLKVVTDLVKKAYPENFKQRATSRVTTVESPSAGTKKRKHSARDLTDDQRSVMRNLIEFGDMTEREYIDDLVKIGDLK